MGLEARCVVEWRAREQTAALHLDSAHLDVALTPKLRIPFARMRSVAVSGERLVIAAAAGALVLHLGAAEATRWGDKILPPRSRPQKLGVSAGQRVCVLA